jgi:UDP-N-acetylmuramate dehydrogenase
MAIQIQKDVLLVPYTTFRIGGVARFFVEVGSEEDLVEALKYAKENNIEYFILGGGSNILVSDKGFDGIVIRMKHEAWNMEQKTGDMEQINIEYWSGVMLSQVVSASVKNGLTGLEWATGIPGTIGGAVRGNAGAFNGEMVQSVVSVRAINTLDSRMEIIKLTNKDCHFKYRSSIFKEENGWIILSITLNLKQGDAKESTNKAREIIRKRVEKQPKYPSAGSFFKNPVVENEKIVELFEKDTKTQSKEKKIPAGWLIEQIGLGGKTIGGAQISEKHSNFIINIGNATAEDVIILSSLIKQKVRNEFGVQLQEEVQLVGF